MDKDTLTSTDNADPKFTQRFSLNLITNLLTIFLSLIIGIFLIPYFLSTLGEIAYGLVPLATSITSYITLLTNSLNTSVSRYLMMDLRSGKITEANQIYNTAFITIIGSVLILLPIALIIAQFSPEIFNIGDIAAADVQLLFSLIFMAALITIVTSNFTATLYAHNRFDLRNIVTITQTIFQVGLIIFFFTVFNPNLVFIGLAYVIAAVIGLGVSIVLSRKTCHDLKFTKEYITKKSFIELWSMTIWTIVKVIGCLFRSNIGLIIANIVCGAIIGAHYSIVIMWQTLLITLMASISILFNPLIFGHCARNEIKELDKVLSIAIRTTAIATALLIGLLTVYAPELLTMWVGDTYSSLTILAIFLILPVLIQAPSDILNNVMIAKLKFRQVAVIYCISGIVTMIFSVIGAYLFGIFGIIIAGGLSMILIEGGGIFAYTAHLLNKKLISLLKYLLPGLAVLVITIGIGYMVKLLFSGDTLITLILGGGIISLLSLLICTHLLLSREDVKAIRSCLPAGIEKKIPAWLL